jgi:glutamine cyclotransferase
MRAGARKDADRRERFQLLLRLSLLVLCCCAAALLLVDRRADAAAVASPAAAAAAAAATHAPPSRTEAQPAQPVVYTYRVVREYPHDPGCFTQGLLVPCTAASASSRRSRRGAVCQRGLLPPV